MSNLKWVDVAHYYLKSGINGMAKLPNSDMKPFALPIGINDVGDYPHRMFTPILRALEDMTEGEARELFEIDGILWEHSSVSDFMDSPKQAYTAQFEKENWVLTPNEFVWLISKGFDVFGLIDSGQAIRKEESNV